MASFFEMGGYAGYVWPAYAVTAVVMGALLVASLRTLRNRETEFRLLQQARPERARRRQTPAAGNAEAAGDA